MEGLRRLLIGVEHDPKAVAAARALALYILPLAVGWLVAWAAHWTDPRLIGLAPLWCVFVRAVGESLIDQLNKPGQNQTDPKPVAGGGAPDLAPHGGKRRP